MSSGVARRGRGPRARGNKVTIARKLLAGFGGLIPIFVVAGLIIGALGGRHHRRKEPARRLFERLQCHARRGGSDTAGPYDPRLHQLPATHGRPRRLLRGFTAGWIIIDRPLIGGAPSSLRRALGQTLMHPWSAWFNFTANRYRGSVAALLDLLGGGQSAPRRKLTQSPIPEVDRHLRRRRVRRPRRGRPRPH
jgi:hypothetical protein